MITLAKLTVLLGWAATINIVFLIFTTVALLVMRDKVLEIHSALFNLNANELPKLYFKYLANLKVLTIVFFLSPYIALKIMGY